MRRAPRVPPPQHPHVMINKGQRLFLISQVDAQHRPVPRQQPPQPFPARLPPPVRTRNTATLTRRTSSLDALETPSSNYRTRRTSASPQATGLTSPSPSNVLLLRGRRHGRATDKGPPRPMCGLTFAAELSVHFPVSARCPAGFPGRGSGRRRAGAVTLGWRSGRA